jgi:hypothetical protein
MPQYGTMTMRRSKQQQKTRLVFQSCRLINLAIGAIIVMMYFCLLFAAFNSIDMLEQQQQQKRVAHVVESSRDLIEKKRRLRAVQDSFDEINNIINNNEHSISAPPFNHRFILFRKLKMGQGAGNIMNGLLAAHLLGQEFNRTVCVESGYKEFHDAFEAIDPFAVKYCSDILDAKTDDEGDASKKESRSRLELVNFALKSAVVNECSLQEQLASPTIKVIEYRGNTYPRWPHVKETNFFFRHYRARQALLDMLPYDYRHQPPPSTVVHLRAPDVHGNDRRQGLDEDSLLALGEELPRGNATFLVTNNVAWFRRFEENYGWSHSNWSSVVHSYFNFSWEEAGVVTDLPATPTDQNLQLWADWYVLLRAKKVYHTNSDFSNSAVHWMSIDAFVIEGFDTTSQRLMLQREAWLLSGETPALCNRTTDILQEDEYSRARLLRGCDPERFNHDNYDYHLK